MIAMCMCIDQEIERFTGYRLDSCDGDRGERLQPGIDYNDTIVTGKQSNIAPGEAALALEHIKPGCEFAGFERNLAFLRHRRTGKCK